MLYERRLDHAVAPPLPATLEHGWLDRPAIARLAGATEQGPGDLLARVDRGERCFGSLRDGRVVAARWATHGAVEADYLRIGLPPARRRRVDLRQLDRPA